MSKSPPAQPGAFVSYRNATQSVPGTMRIEGSNRRLSLHWTSLAEGNANFSIVIVFRYADDLMVGFEHRPAAAWAVAFWVVFFAVFVLFVLATSASCPGQRL